MRDLVTITVAHAYYARQQMRRYRLSAHPATAEFLDKNKMLLHHAANRSSIVGSAGTSALWKPLGAEPGCTVLAFDLLPHDPLFYTASSVAWERGGICCICNREGQEVVDVHRCMSKECGKYDERDAATTIMKWCVYLYVSDDELAVGGITVTFRFPAVAAYWKYCLFCDNEKEGLCVTDNDGMQEFIPEKSVWEQGDKMQYTFTSTQKMPVQELVTGKFRLQLRKNDLVRTLIARLPGAVPGGLCKVKQHEDDLVSSVLINL